MSDSTAYSLMSLQQDLPEELPRWDYSEDVLGNFEHFADTATGSQAFAGPDAVAAAGLLAEEPAGPSSLQPDPGGPSARVTGQRGGSAETRKQAQNRQAQQRFRQRQRAKAETLEAQLAATTTQVQQLQASQRLLEARNALLESVASTTLGSAQEAPAAAVDWANAPSTASDDQRTIVLTVLDDQDLVKSVAEVGQMPFTAFAALYSAYARKMNRCLLETSQSGNSPAIMQELREWSSQVNSLIVFLAVGNVRNFVAFTGSRLDGNPGPSVAELPDSWYQSFTATMHLTEAQQADMMHLRRLFYAKIGALRRERELLLQKVPSGAAATTPDAATRLADINTIAQQLHDNSAAEFRAYMQLSAAYCRGILTLMQQVVGIVKAFPFIPVKPRVLEVLAAMRHEPPTSLLTQSQGIDDFEHNTNWQSVVNYLKMITDDNLHLHVPLVDRR